MKKVLLTAALGCAMISPAFAAGGVEANAGLPFQVNDYIELLPNGLFPPDPLTVIFTNPTEMAAGMNLPDGHYSVRASRSWHVDYSATDFVRTSPFEPGISQTIPVDQILTVSATSSDILVTGTPYHPATNSAALLASGHGGDGRPYDVHGKITPGNVWATHNLEGVYQTDVTQIASLD